MPPTPRGPIGMPRGPRVGPGGPNLDFVGGGKWGKVGPQGQRDPPRGARRRVSVTAANSVHGASDMSASRPETIFKVVRGPNPGGGILGRFFGKLEGPFRGVHLTQNTQPPGPGTPISRCADPCYIGIPGDQPIWQQDLASHEEISFFFGQITQIWEGAFWEFWRGHGMAWVWRGLAWVWRGLAWV